jgi:RND family efflux transporter MFP subunit
MNLRKYFTHSMKGLRLIYGCLTLVCAWTLNFEAQLARAADLQPTGIIEPFLDVTLSTSVPGIVTTRKFEEGNFVKEGAVILELDSNLEELEVERRKIVRDEKRRDFEGTQRLFKTTKGMSKDEVDKKESEYKVAAVEHDMAVEQKRRRQLLAPNAGVITDIFIEVGEACQSYQPLVRVVDSRRCYLITNVESRQGSRLKLDQKVTLEIDVGDSKVVVPGAIVFLSPVVDPASGLQRVKILFENKDGRIRPGLTGFMLSETQG